MIIEWVDIEQELLAQAASVNEINAKRQIFNSRLFQIYILCELGIVTSKLLPRKNQAEGVAKTIGVVEDLGTLDTYELISFLEKHNPSFKQASTITPGQMALLGEAHADKITSALLSGLEEKSDFVRYSLSAIVQTGFPYTKIKGQQHFERRNGDLTVTMSAPNDIGLPYGIYPRLAFVHLCSEIVKQKARKISLGTSLKRFVIDEMGRPWSTGAKGTANSWRQALMSLLATTFTITYRIKDSQGKQQGMELCNVSIVDKAKLWWDTDYDELEGAELEVSEVFASALLDHATPLDIRALEKLGELRSPLAFDLYCWLTYRFWSMEERRTPIARISWSQLYEQLGTSIQTMRHFKIEVRKALETVKNVYPQANFNASNDNFLLLISSPPHISPRRDTNPQLEN